MQWLKLSQVKPEVFLAIQPPPPPMRPIEAVTSGSRLAGCPSPSAYLDPLLLLFLPGLEKEEGN